MKKIISVLFLIITIMGFTEEYSPIYPTTLQINIEKQKGTGEFTVFNTSNERKSFEVSIKDIDNRGEPSELSKYMKIFPRKFSLEPGKNKDIRVMITDIPQEMIGKGEYRAAILIKGLSSQINEKYESQSQKGIQTVINLKIDVSMAIYGLSGNEFQNIEVLSLKPSKNEKGEETFKLAIKNTGNYSYEVYLRSLDIKGKEKYKGYPFKIVSGYSQVAEIPKNELYEIQVIDKESDKLIKNFKIEDLMKQIE